MILDRFRLDGKVALVTGASRGLGRAVAVALFLPLAVAYVLPPAIDSLHRYADDHNIQRSVRVGPSVFGGRGLLATRRLTAGEPVLQVPLELTLSTARDGNTAKQDPSSHHDRASAAARPQKGFEV